MAHFLFNVSDEQQPNALLEAKMWGVRPNEPHRDELAPGDLVLIYLAPPRARFIGRAEVASAVHDWTPSETEGYPGDPPSGVVLAHVEEWDPAVPMDAVVQRVDPTASNPLVQANAAAGFPLGLVRISAREYEAALALSREARET
jgi:EVE domain